MKFWSERNHFIVQTFVQSISAWNDSHNKLTSLYLMQVFNEMSFLILNNRRDRRIEVHTIGRLSQQKKLFLIEFQIVISFCSQTSYNFKFPFPSRFTQIKFRIFQSNVRKWENFCKKRQQTWKTFSLLSSYNKTFSHEKWNSSETHEKENVLRFSTFQIILKVSKKKLTYLQ